MKIKKIFAVLSLSLIAAGGLAAGLSLEGEAKAAINVDATVGASGNVIIRKDDNDMKYTGSSLVAYLFNDTENAWIEPVANDGKTYQELTWSLEFVPTKIIVLRVDTANWKATDPWNNVWSRTGNVDLSDTEVIWMKGTAGEYTSGDWGSFSCVATVEGGATDDWTVATLEKGLGKIKTDGNKIEVYGSVSFAADTYFKVVKGSDWYGNYTAHSSISSNLSTSESGNIHNTEAATYEVFFNFESPSVYITDPVIASADEWAQEFLGANCDATKSGWGTSKTSFEALSLEAQAIIEGQEHVDHKSEAKSFVAQAVQRYDYVLERYGVYDVTINPDGYIDFLGRVNAHLVTPGIASGRINFNDFINGDNTALIVVIASAVTITAVVALVLIKKKRHN